MLYFVAHEFNFWCLRRRTSYFFFQKSNSLTLSLHQTDWNKHSADTGWENANLHEWSCDSGHSSSSATGPISCRCLCHFKGSVHSNKKNKYINLSGGVEPCRSFGFNLFRYQVKTVNYQFGESNWAHSNILKYYTLMTFWGT